MHVTIVSQYFWPESFRVNDLATGLADRGHRVCVLTGYPSYPHRDLYGDRRPATEAYGKVDVVRVPLASRGDGQRWRLAANYLTYAAAASVLGPSRLPAGTDVTLVFQMSPVTQAIPAIVLRATRRAPVVLWVQDLWPDSVKAAGAVRSGPLVAALGTVARSIYRRCDRVLVQSEAFRGPLQRVGVPGHLLDYVPNWAEDAYRPVRPDSTCQAPRVDIPDGFIVMAAGNIGHAQSVETLLGAAERLRALPDVRWVVVGDGARRDWFSVEVARRGLADRVSLVGRQPVEQMPGLFARADALCVTLRRDPVLAMTVPSRLQSYLACGRPVVAAADGEGARVVRDAGSLAVPAEDAAGLADSVLRLRSMSTAARAAVGESARRYYLDHFDRSSLLDRIEGVLADAVLGSGRHGVATARRGQQDRLNPQLARPCPPPSPSGGQLDSGPVLTRLPPVAAANTGGG